jgi:hypothetical protein
MSFWNDKRDAELVDLIKRGLSYSEIANKLGTTKNSVCGRAHRRGFNTGANPGGPRAQHGGQNRKNFTPEQRETITRLYQKNVPFRDIGRSVGCGGDAVARVVIEMIEAGAVEPRAKPIGNRYTTQPRSAPVAPPVAPAAGHGVSFMDLRPGQCRYPTFAGKPPLQHMTFCAEPVEPGESWCANCLRIVLAREAA